ncbi:hypothetical protein LCL87_15990 [Rhodococcus hoagii]|nr:hypothetical protein [Prescottella equi]
MRRTADVIEFVLPGCEAANRAGLVAAGIGAAALAASAVIWWRQRSALTGAGGQ